MTAHQPYDAGTARTSGPGDTSGTDSPPVRVLIVDDHEVLAASLSLVLDDQPGLTTVGVKSSTW